MCSVVYGVLKEECWVYRIIWSVECSTKIVECNIFIVKCGVYISLIMQYHLNFNFKQASSDTILNSSAVLKNVTDN